MLKDRYKMTQEDNILIAKRLLVDNIYKSANLEGIAVTFAQTNDILNDIGVENVKPTEISKVFCLRDGWKYIINNINENLHLGFIEELHNLVAKADLSYEDLGKIRADDVLISGTSWRPEIPNPENLHKELNTLLELSSNTDKAISVMLWIMRNQIFKDGNKRVGMLIANKILIENGNGIISVPVEFDSKFKELLVEFYETNNTENIKRWLYENCLDGINPI